MDIRKIKKLIELLEESSLTEIEIVEGEESVRLARGGQATYMPVAHPAPLPEQVPIAAAAATELAQAVDDGQEQVPEGEMVLAPKKIQTFESSFESYREGAAGANGGKVGGGCGCN